jgi:nucleoside-diphosphate-sugar epimerase
MKKVLVIGGQGFVGSNINLSNEKYEKYSIDKKPRSKKNLNYSDHFTGDIADISVNEFINRLQPEVLIVLAGQQFETPVQKKFQRKKSFSKNVVISEKIVELVSKVSSIKQIIYVSTDMVYGKPKAILVNEKTNPEPIGEYGKSKLRAEETLSIHSDKIVILRPRLIVGPGREGTVALLATFLRRNLPVPIIGSGDNRYQMISVFDLWDAIDICISTQARGVFNIGSKSPPTLNELFASVLPRLQKENRVLHLPRRICELALTFLDFFGLSPLAPEQYLIAGHSCVLDTRKIESLGWVPKYSDEDMLVERLRSIL